MSRAATIDLDAAYASCARDARRHSENFPVASLLVPASMRRDIAAIYAFARAADDFADEGERLDDERLALLDGWLHRLRHAAASGEPGPAPRPGEPANSVAIFLALGASIRQRQLPLTEFEDLISAFRQDVTVTHYKGWDDVLDYCRRSAEPIGRLVLRVAGYGDAQRIAWSDSICTALQLTNFWQDLTIDLERGRSYLPDAEWRAHETRPRAIAAAVARTRALFDAGRPLCDAVTGRLRYELRATWLGGVRILDRIERAGFDVAQRRPALGIIDAPWFVVRLLLWPRA
jgi:phytoene synthase